MKCDVHGTPDWVGAVLTWVHNAQQMKCAIHMKTADPSGYGQETLVGTASTLVFTDVS